MGEKGAKLTDNAQHACTNLLGSLSDLGNISSKKMFGGFGIFEEESMFALVNSQGEVFFKADKLTASMYENAGSGKHGKMPYYKVPDKILKERRALKNWAKTSIDLAHRTKK